ncbi:hypothetical protein Egran_03531 [Elaphomyces granulatus]|uniref:Uncharacterized protein n=1 Tax=Elaphomyces granulatus TaxID=519963 RepID=A0A232LX21_9EURO|nr:hypothetical protein Egran_03531 [Elaphomyces granulatus]
MESYMDRIAGRSGNQSVFPKDFSQSTRDAAGFDVDREIEEDIQEEQENTRSFAAETTKWEKMRQAGQKLSESALTAGTIKSYENLWKQFLKYCEGFGDTHLENMKLLGQDTPSYIVCWIMEACESEGSADLPDTKDSHALKMRAAVNWGFAYKMRIGSNEP